MTKKEAQRNAALNGGRGSGQTVRLISEIYEAKIADLERENRLLGERCNQLLRDKGELTEKIADIKANCDLAIEGRDIKIKELELELTVEKDQHQEEINLHLHAEEYIKSLEKENAELRDNYEQYKAVAEPTIKELEAQIEKMKKYAKLLQDICVVLGNNATMVAIGLEKRVQELWDTDRVEEGKKLVADIETRLSEIKPHEWAEIEELRK